MFFCIFKTCIYIIIIIGREREFYFIQKLIRKNETILLQTLLTTRSRCHYLSSYDAWLSRQAIVQEWACDPDPCKHEGVCRLDTRNHSLSTCVCKGEYTGNHCELKTGCFKNPCKNDGNCTYDPADKTKHVCKCKEGWVGNCDTSKHYLLIYSLSAQTFTSM